MEMFNVFISQPMNGKTSKEILAERTKIIESAVRFCPKDKVMNIIPSYFGDFDNVVVKNKPLFYLGKSIEMLAEADLAVFGKGWGDARGCVIEKLCAERYGIETYCV